LACVGGQCLPDFGIFWDFLGEFGMSALIDAMIADAKALAREHVDFDIAPMEYAPPRIPLKCRAIWLFCYKDYFAEFYAES